MAAAIGYIGAAALGYLGTRQQNDTSAQNSAAANATSIDLANTSYQRRVKDLDAAGLNPMLAYQQGGAAVPSMLTPAVQNQLGDAVNSGQQAYSAMKQGELQSAQVDTQKSQTDLNKTMAMKALNDADLSSASAQEVRARTPTYEANISKTLSEIDKIAADTNLSISQRAKVKQETVNAILTGKQILANTGNTVADTRLKQLNYTLGSTDLPAAYNSEHAANTSYGHLIAPFLPDFMKGSQAIKNFR